MRLAVNDYNNGDTAAHTRNFSIVVFHRDNKSILIHYDRDIHRRNAHDLDAGKTNVQMIYQSPVTWT